MRQAIIDEIHFQMKENKNIYFLTGDLGYDTLEKIEKDFPTRFINIGVAEQNMIGIASGLALSGKKVFVYSIIPFLTMRCFEQIRNDICYHNLNVTLLGVGAGLSYGVLGTTHHSLEDVAILSTLPNMHIFSPCDELEAILGVRYFKDFSYPLYIRIGGRKESQIYKKPFNFQFGKGNIIRKGKDIIFFVTGTLMEEVIKAVEIIEAEKKISSTVVDMHTLKPIDKNLVINESKNKKLAVTVEEHGIIGGLGSFVSSIFAENNIKVKLLQIGVQNQFIKIVGIRKYLRKILKLDSEGIKEQVIKSLNKIDEN